MLKYYFGSLSYKNIKFEEKKYHCSSIKRGVLCAKYSIWDSHLYR